jgi:hypothetical protein
VGGPVRPPGGGAGPNPAEMWLRFVPLSHFRLRFFGKRGVWLRFVPLSHFRLRFFGKRGVWLRFVPL